jgi:prepilin-type N-terminal cleavage/methylation domain-containing protein
MARESVKARPWAAYPREEHKMTGTRGRRPAFTLTEVLMAVGILGVGLTMVASIFPVAVDQSRRSRETTEAALCARSASAMIRVLRNDLVTWRRTPPRKTAYGSIEANTENYFYNLPGRLKVYDPAEFLYDHEDENGNPNRSYDSTNVWVDEGSKANYVPRVFMTPISTNNPGGGPWRVILAIYRSQGKGPSNIITQERWTTSSVWPKMGPGRYVLDGTSYDGYAYLVDSIEEGLNPKDNPGYATLATGARAKGDEPGVVDWRWRCLVVGSEAVAVYHTVLGD